MIDEIRSPTESNEEDRVFWKNLLAVQPDCNMLKKAPAFLQQKRSELNKDEATAGSANVFPRTLLKSEREIQPAFSGIQVCVHIPFSNLLFVSNLWQIYELNEDQLHALVTCAVMQGPHSYVDPELGFMLYCCCLEILSHFEKKPCIFILRRAPLIM